MEEKNPTEECIENNNSGDESEEIDSKKAGKLRKKLHIHSANGNLTEVRQLLRELYDSVNSPINDAANTPEKFSAIIESTILSLLSSNEALGSEMIKNIDHLFEAYGISKKNKKSALEIIEKHISTFRDSDLSFSQLSVALQDDLCKNTCFKSIKIGRYSDKFSISKKDTDTKEEE